MVGIRSSGFNTRYSTKERHEVQFTNKNLCDNKKECESKDKNKDTHTHVQDKKIADFVKKI